MFTYYLPTVFILTICGSVFFAGVHRIICSMPGKYFSLIICDVGKRDLSTTDTRAFFSLGPSVGCILLGLPTGRLFLAEVVATLLEVAAATFHSDAPELFSQQFAILGQKNDIRDVCDVAASLISSSELSLITIAITISFSVTRKQWTDETRVQRSKV